jgi:hypothetical protein
MLWGLAIIKTIRLRPNLQQTPFLFKTLTRPFRCLSKFNSARLYTDALTHRSCGHANTAAIQSYKSTYTHYQPHKK